MGSTGCGEARKGEGGGVTHSGMVLTMNWVLTSAVDKSRSERGKMCFCVVELGGQWCGQVGRAWRHVGVVDNLLAYSTSVCVPETQLNFVTSTS